MKKCPHCHKNIEYDAVVCRYCYKNVRYVWVKRLIFLSVLAGVYMCYIFIRSNSEYWMEVYYEVRYIFGRVLEEIRVGVYVLRGYFGRVLNYFGM